MLSFRREQEGQKLSSQLNAAIRHLYVMFDYPPPRKLAGYEQAADSPEEVDDYHALLTIPRGELSPELLKKLYWRVGLNACSAEDFKYFVPRLLELLTSGSDHGLDYCIALQKLTQCDWLDWQQDEIDAVRYFLGTWWRWCLALDVEVLQTEFLLDAETLMCAIAQAELDIGSYLMDWRERHSVTPTVHLANLISTNAEILKERKLNHSWWGMAKPQLSQFIEWILSDETKDQLEWAAADKNLTPLQRQTITSAQEAFSTMQEHVLSRHRLEKLYRESPEK